MNVRGVHRFEVPRECVFAAIRDPHTLMAVIPGCDAVEQIGDDEYEARISVRLPGAVGSYRTRVRLVEVRAPEHAGLLGHVEGAMGSISGDAQFDLAETGTTTVLDYFGSAVIQGPLARLDSRLIERFAETLISQGLKALERRLAAELVA